MTKEQVKRILDRVTEWPLERQADLAEIAMLMEEQDKSTIGLNEDQAEEVAPPFRGQPQEHQPVRVQRALAPPLRRMKVVLRQDAEDDLDRIFAWIAESNPSAASRTVARIRDRIGLLELDSLAHKGRPGTVSDTRELIEYP